MGGALILAASSIMVLMSELSDLNQRASSGAGRAVSLRAGGSESTRMDRPSRPLLSMSDADVDLAIQRHHPLNRLGLQCGDWPEAYARLHSDILGGRAPQVPRGPPSEAQT